ncbi:O-methyltransferase [Salinibacter ruber]|uniref:O-methyltransferase YrrM n=1 Tax=Salinibacter ruber TaxID=146919 RepID=A0A9X2PY93_9BACT|nr:class I SAM-dependent methyltransferase [Salinibacter ruber]MCS3678769.1 putative O-methyltransferase YrrM [Salinibacter ruber]
MALNRLFDEFSTQPVELRELPKGPWSTPLSDVIPLLKIVCCADPQRLLEVGSYRGYTALLLAQHMSENAQLVTVDQDERHGEAYRDTAYAEHIERRVGVTGTGVLDDPDGSYDFIFLDAGHQYHEVKHDTELLLPLLSDTGVFLWHDYANWGFFRPVDGAPVNGVPEYLNELSDDIPIAHVSGADLAIHSPCWGSSQHDRFRNALMHNEGTAWETEQMRG